MPILTKISSIKKFFSSHLFYMSIKNLKYLLEMSNRGNFKETVTLYEHKLVSRNNAVQNIQEKLKKAKLYNIKRL